MDITYLKSVHLTARKARNTHAVKTLSTLIADLEYQQEKGSVIDANKIVSTINKYIENANKLAELEPMNVDHALEGELLEGLLPKMLTGAEIYNILVKENPANMKEAMGILKQSYAGQFDGKTASTEARKFLGM